VIVASLVLILVAVALLVLGLAGGSSLLLIGSIVASLLAAVALVVGARQAAAARTASAMDDRAAGRRGGGEDRHGARYQTGTGDHRSTVRPDADVEPIPGGPAEPTIPTQTVPEDVNPSTETGWRQPTGEPDAGYGYDGGVPVDEPAAQEVPAADAAIIARLGADVLVIDGRPRYHLADCPHLAGQESEALPVSEAVELGFTPCGRCEPDSALLADAPRN
jgi:hypothetical protein